MKRDLGFRCHKCDAALPLHNPDCSWSPENMRKGLIQTLAAASPDWLQEWRDVMVKQGRDTEMHNLLNAAHAYKTNQGALPL